MNSHSFTKTDVNNQHKTLDTIDNIPNPEYIGKAFLNYYKNTTVILLTNKKKFIFDGDTIEFVTQDFIRKM
jgi:hypothetical protein